MSSIKRFATLRLAARVWAVAAVHGEATRLAAIHDALGQRLRPGDRLVYLGNYLGHGPAIRETLDELIRFRREVIALPFMFAGDHVFLRGAQEEMWQKLLQLQFAADPREVLAWLLAHGAGATIAAYGGDVRRGESAARDSALTIMRWTSALREAMRAAPGHEPFFAALRRAVRTDDGQLLFVHAGLNPDLPLDEQKDSLWWDTAGFARILRPYADYRMVVRGYDRAHGGLVRTTFTTSIDAGCGFGGKLMAVCFSPEGTVMEALSA